MKNKTTTYKWAYLPFVFSSAAILATQVSAGPAGSQQYQDARQVNNVNHEYVGGKTQAGFGVTDDGDVDVELNQVISESDNHSTGVGLWAGYDVKGDDKGMLGRGAQINHNWVSRDRSGQAHHVNKVFAAYDRNDRGHDKATVGYGQENEDLFWEGHVSKGLSGRKDGRLINGQTISDQAYDWGVGASVGTFMPNSNIRVRAGLDHEWSDEVGIGEKDARNTTLSAGIEKFFQGTGHSLSLDVAGSKQSGGYLDGGIDDEDITGRLGYRYDFGGASVYQPDRRYRRVRVEVPGQAVAPRYAVKQQFKRVPTYKSVPVYGNKTIRKPYKQLVKSTMELEGQTFFKLNSSKLIPSAQTRLKQIAAQIRKSGYKGSIRITGNTCGLGNAKYDQILSEKRAKAVRNFLIKNGFNPNHLIARGLGKGHPKYPNTPSQGFKNRRVDIEYVSEQKKFKTGYRTEQQRVQTGTRRVATGFKNVPAGTKRVMIDNGRPGTPRVIWKTEAIPTSPAWIKRALHNNIRHNRDVNTFETTKGSTTGPTNSAPIATDDFSNTNCGGPVTIDVLGNDNDPDGDTLTIQSFTQPANGTVTQGPNGTLIYTSNGNACGLDDQFTYTITDGNGNTDTATVTVSVDDVTVDDDVKAADDFATTNQDQAVTINVLGNDDADASIVRIKTNPSNGSASIVNGQIVYTPNSGFSGTDTFSYEVRDPNGNLAMADVTVTVDPLIANDNPPVAVDDATSVTCNGAVTIDVIGDNDFDVDGDILSIQSFTQPANGTVTRGPNDTLIYTSNGNGCGLDDQFTYTITDGNGNTSTATVTVSVEEPVDDDVNAADDTATTNQGEAVTINVLGNDDADATLVRIKTNPSNGSARIVNGQIVYTPDAGFSGTDTFSYEVRDPEGNLAMADVTVTVNDNDVKAANDSATTNQGEAVTINVLRNDDSDATITRIKRSPSNGTARVVNGQIVYTPDAGFSGTDSFSYEVRDPEGNLAMADVTVTVNDDDVKAADDSATTNQGEAVTINVLRNDDSDATITRIKRNPSNGTARVVNGQIVYIPDAGFSGTDSFTYEVRDPNGNLAMARVTVTVIAEPNKPPVAKDDSANTQQGQSVTLNTLANDSDPDGDTLRITSVDNPSNGTAVISGGQIIYTPDAGFSGTDRFSYTISDGNGGTATAIETVTVTPDVNKAPIANNDMASTGCSAINIDVLGNDTDPDGDALSIISVSGGSLGTAVVSGSQIVYTPSNTCGKGTTGTDHLSYTISDGNGNTASANVKVDVKGVTHGGDTNAEPDDVMTTEGQTVKINVLANDAGTGLRIIAVDNPKNGTAMIMGDSIKYTPAPGFTGTDSFWYDIVDANGYNDSALILVYVEEKCSTGKCN